MKLSYLRVKLSNGKFSPSFELEGTKQYNPKEEDIDMDYKINLIAFDGRSDLRFFNDQGEEAMRYDPDGKSNPLLLRHIGEDEELVGVYGIKD